MDQEAIIYSQDLGRVFSNGVSGLEQTSGEGCLDTVGEPTSSTVSVSKRENNINRISFEPEFHHLMDSTHGT